MSAPRTELGSFASAPAGALASGPRTSRAPPGLAASRQVVAAETAVAVEGARDPVAGAADAELEPAAGAAVLVERRRVAARAEGGGGERDRRQLHQSVTTGITIGCRLVRR